jgi:hypothetical protein
LAGISEQLQGNIAIHGCLTLRSLQVSGAVVTGERKLRTDTTRADGIDRELQFFMAVVPQDKITFFVATFDVADPETAPGVAIAAGTQATGTPLPSPTTPCPGLLTD